MQQNNKIGILIFSVSAIIISLMFILKSLKEKKIITEGVFQVAKTINKEKAKNGTQYNFSYSYKGVYYTGGILTTTSIDTIFLIKLLPKSPKKWMFVESKLPLCLPKSSFSDTGWRVLPVCK